MVRETTEAWALRGSQVSAGSSQGRILPQQHGGPRGWAQNAPVPALLRKVLPEHFAGTWAS